MGERVYRAIDFRDAPGCGNRTVYRDGLPLFSRVSPWVLTTRLWLTTLTFSVAPALLAVFLTPGRPIYRFPLTNRELTAQGPSRVERGPRKCPMRVKTVAQAPGEKNGLSGLVEVRKPLVEGHTRVVRQDSGILRKSTGGSPAHRQGTQKSATFMLCLCPVRPPGDSFLQESLFTRILLTKSILTRKLIIRQSSGKNGFNDTACYAPVGR